MQNKLKNQLFFSFFLIKAARQNKYNRSVSTTSSEPQNNDYRSQQQPSASSFLAKFQPVQETNHNNNNNNNKAHIESQSQHQKHSQSVNQNILKNSKFTFRIEVPNTNSFSSKN